MIMYFLAIDIGASSGRHILGHIENGKMLIEEMYRFPNGNKKVDGSLTWDIDDLFSSIKKGIRACVEAGKAPDYIGIDTWGVDYVLLDKNDRVLGKTYGYRDSRTNGMDTELYKTVPESELYARTGIQKAIFNTVYQLEADKVNEPEKLAAAETFLFVPEYFSYLLTGNKMTEYTIASTSQLLKADTFDWDYEMLDKLGFPKKIFQKIAKPGTVLGDLKEDICNETGCRGAKVILPACHDTGSAVAAVPTNEDDIVYISSGTWSLIGIERMTPDCSELSRSHNFTNEGGYDRRFRYLKNITGLWMIQSMKKELKAKGQDYTFDQLCDMAKEYDSTPLRVNANDDRFLSPDSMIDEVAAAVGRESLTVGEMFAVVYHSLADSYGLSVKEIEEVTGKKIKAVHIVGGGCKDDYLNDLTAKATGKPVYAGPVEATAIGNLTVQMLSVGVFGSLNEARQTIFNSFDVKKI
ncbi:MAG: rhamnulokinase [Firmicutes bacterium]|nr:rhamnulokinase [Candidatus Colimorpha enterica]